MGYGSRQVADLAATIEATPCDAVVSATPIDLNRVLSVSKPLVRARYDLREQQPGQLEAAVRTILGE
jgi:predicted GTPase